MEIQLILFARLILQEQIELVWLVFFSNLNLGNDPDDTIVISQPAQEAVYLTAAFQTQDGTASYTESGEVGAQYGIEYPTYAIGNNTEIPLPNIPAGGVDDLRIMINSNMTADQPNF